MRRELIARAAALAVVFAAVLVTPAAAETDYWDYRDWHTVRDSVDTGEDLRVTCSARTGGDGYPVLEVSLTNGDVTPPDAYPDVIFEERAPRHHATVMKDGDTINFVFDDGDSAQATAYGYLDNDGFAVAEAVMKSEDSLRVLQAMQRNGQIDIVGGGKLIYTASLNGFTAAYGKMAEACSFSTVGVID